MMKHLFLALSTAALLCAPMSSAWAQPGPEDPEASDADPAEAVPPPPTTQPAPPPRIPPPIQARAAPATGQWVYTQQYGWIWMPYGDQYVQAPAAAQASTDASPMEYVYAPVYGWTWVNAPWIWGWGPELYFGVGGAGHFGWYHPRAIVGHGAGPRVVGRLGGGHFGGGHFGGGHFGGGHFGGHGGGHR
jgi:hypothetical protein